jgi:hypothetical protein
MLVNAVALKAEAHDLWFAARLHENGYEADTNGRSGPSLHPSPSYVGEQTSVDLLVAHDVLLDLFGTNSVPPPVGLMTTESTRHGSARRRWTVNGPGRGRSAVRER